MLSFECGIPRPQDVGHLCFRLFWLSKSDPGQESNLEVSTDLGYFKVFNPFYNLNCSAWERASWRRGTEKSHFSTLNVGLAGTGNQTRATCMAGSISRRSAIHYALGAKRVMWHIKLISVRYWITLKCEILNLLRVWDPKSLFSVSYWFPFKCELILNRFLMWDTESPLSVKHRITFKCDILNLNGVNY
jgi:hypothetical protein